MPTARFTFPGPAFSDMYIVDNYCCFGRVVISSGFNKQERDMIQQAFESQELSPLVDGIRDCQKWVTESLLALGFDEFVRFWEERRGGTIGTLR